MLKRLCPCRFLVPVAYNDGSLVEPEVMVKIMHDLNVKFGGYRVLPVSQGCWQGQAEGVHEFEVAVPKREIPNLRKYVEEIGETLKQECMYFVAASPSVELIDTSGRKGKKDGKN